MTTELAKVHPFLVAHRQEALAIAKEIADEHDRKIFDELHRQGKKVGRTLKNRTSPKLKLAMKKRGAFFNKTMRPTPLSTAE
jgi:hypothetical protein